MVHAIKLQWKLGCGRLTEQRAARCHAMVEAGYLFGSLLFTIGTVYFFPIEGFEDFTLGCRYYEAGSVVFAVLTGYSELDRLHSRRTKAKDPVAGPSDVTKRELLEQVLYCAGSFVFLIGTFFFDPTCVTGLAAVFNVSKSDVENTAAVLFMVGSFMFSFGAYVNALSIFESPRMFRKSLISVTTSYMFGGLFFVAGTMGYVEAFEPNLTLKWCATWFYLVGCFFYVFGSFMSLVSTVARHQVGWERVQKTEHEKKSRLARAARAASRRFKRKPHQQPKAPDADHEPDDTLNLEGLEEAASDVALEDLDVETNMSDELELAISLGDGGEMAEEEDIFGAFWRGVVTAMDPTASASPSQDSDRASGASSGGAPGTPALPSRAIGASENDSMAFMQARAG